MSAKERIETGVEAPASSEAGQPRVWVLESTGAGANRQLLNLATELGWPFEFKRALDALPRALWDRLYWPGWRRVPSRKHDQLRPPWPDLVLFSGGRSVVDALRIRAMSGGHSRLVCIGRPGAPLAWFDRIIVTPQYGLPEHPGVVQLTLPLNHVDPHATRAAARRWQPALSHLPRPWLGVLLGGDSGSYRFTGDAARELGRRVDERARALGGALLITSSARTPPQALAALLAEVSVPYYCYRWRRDDDDNPIQGILALADYFVVTADSASMPAEASATGRPVAGFTPPLRWRARLLSRFRLPAGAGRLRDALSELHRRLVVRGLWVPARDMSRVHAVLEQRGLIRPIAELGRGDEYQPVVVDDTARAVASVQALWPDAGGPGAKADRIPVSGSRPRS